MSNYTLKLSSLAERKKKLQEEELKLIERRKKEMGELAERFGLLTAADTFLAGLMLEVQTALHAQSDKRKQWESEGARFLQSKQSAKTINKIKG